MGFDKISDTRKLLFKVQGEQPLARPFYSGGAPFNPELVEVSVSNGVVARPYVSGPGYLATGKLGKRVVGDYFAKDYAPPWLLSLMAAEKLEWPT